MNIVAHNLVAMNAQRQFGIVNKSRAKSIEKLSSGYQINRAADNAAGLAISEKMRRQIRGLTQASSNCQDGISFVQVADGALNEVHDMLHRLTQLSVQSANGTNTDEDRNAINEEVKEIKAEMARIFTTTEFNGQKIWGPNEADKVQVGTDTIVDTQTYPAVTFQATSNTVSVNNQNKEAMPRYSMSVSASVAGIVVSWTGYNGTSYTSDTVPWAQDLEGTHSFKLSDYMDYSAHPEARGIDFTYSYKVNGKSELSDVISAINNTGYYVSASQNASVTTEVARTNPALSSMASISTSINYDAQLASGKDFEAFDDGFMEGNSIVNPFQNPSDSGRDFAFSFDMPGIGRVNSTVSNAYYTGSYSSTISDHTGEGLWFRYSTNTRGELYKSSISHNATPDNASADAILDAIYDSDGSGNSLFYDNVNGSGTYYLTFNLTSENPYTRADGGTTNAVGSMSMYIYFSKDAATTADEFADKVRNALANISAVDVADTDNTSPSTFRLSQSTKNSSNKYTETNTTYEPIYEYQIDENHRVSIMAGAESSEANQIHLDYTNLNLEILGIADLDVSTLQGANHAISAVDNALARVSAERSRFGAYQNRLEHTMNNLNNVVENTTAAESQIRDTNMETEMVSLSRDNILAQVGQAMMTQANQSNQGVLSLLQ